MKERVCVNYPLLLLSGKGMGNVNMNLLDYYAGDEFCAGVWESKYALKGRWVSYSIIPHHGTISNVNELTPAAMHLRLAKELERVDRALPGGSYFMEGEIFSYLDRYKYIIPQGSIMAMLGSDKIGSLSNCFVIPSPVDSYGGIFKTDEQIAQLQKRRGGVGLNLNTLRPEGTRVSNAAGTSTGAHSFMDRYSNTTREVAQNGRRGALMLLLDCRHPDVFKFVKKKSDLTKVTGANISVMLTDKFMRAVEKDEDFMCKFPIHNDFEQLKSIVEGQVEFEDLDFSKYGYNQVVTLPTRDTSQFMRIKARELYQEIVNQAWSSGEPGVAFIDRVHSYSPEGVYDQYRAVASNPCGEQWMQAYDACRLLCLNLYNVVIHPWKKDAHVDYDLLYKIAFAQQRLADDVVELEIQHVNRIITKIQMDKDPEDVKKNELDLWMKIKDVASSSRRTGCGFTALADMLAALGLKYDSQDALSTVQKVMHTKMRAELDCTIQLAKERGPFKGWDVNKEFTYGFAPSPSSTDKIWQGNNDFYNMLLKEFPEQVMEMMKYGRRNVSWSTVAPTGTVSIVSLLDKYPNTSAGVEPQFACYYYRNKKVNAGEEGVRVDFTDQNGDSWQTSPVIMGGLKEWIDATGLPAGFVGVDQLPKPVLEELFKKSPYYGSCAADIDWEKRIEMQALVQKYTTNAISSTLNLPKETSKNVVNDIYFKAWKSGLKGVTIYRDGCRTGVLNTTSTSANSGASKFTYRDAIKRPKELEARLDIVSVKGTKYAVVVGMLDDNPYEVFAFNLPSEIKEPCAGKIVKVKKGHYNFICDEATLKGIQEIAVKKEEQTLTRLVSGMLRHGAKPEWVIGQIDKCDLEIVSFGKAISRVLSKFIGKQEVGEKCPNCGGKLLKQEGCTKCTSCEYSKC